MTTTSEAKANLTERSFTSLQMVHTHTHTSHRSGVDQGPDGIKAPAGQVKMRMKKGWKGDDDEDDMKTI